LAAQSASVAQLLAQIAVSPLHARGDAQAAGVLPSGRSVQIPSALAPRACVHASHSPVLAALQQTPSEQNPLSQSALVVHGPFPTRVNTVAEP
jgi:hypothetical protein